MTSAAKLDGLRLELDMQGLDFTPEQVVAAEFSANAGYSQTKQLAKGGRALTHNLCRR